jgi:hypothetical protein
MLNRLLLVSFIAIFCVAALVTTSNRAQVPDKTGPALGDILDLRTWSARDGRTLAQVIKAHSIAMILIVNPSCETCADAKDGFRTLRERVGKARIGYYVLMIPESTDTQKVFSYADSLKIDADVFVWSSTETKAPISLATMAVPSHLLITNEGLVVNKWPGTTPTP